MAIITRIGPRPGVAEMKRYLLMIVVCIVFALVTTTVANVFDVKISSVSFWGGIAYRVVLMLGGAVIGFILMAKNESR